MLNTTYPMQVHVGDAYLNAYLDTYLDAYLNACVCPWAASDHTYATVQKSDPGHAAWGEHTARGHAPNQLEWAIVLLQAVLSIGREWGCKRGGLERVIRPQPAFIGHPPTYRGAWRCALSRKYLGHRGRWSRSSAYTAPTPQAVVAGGAVVSHVLPSRFSRTLWTTQHIHTTRPEVV